MKSNVSDFLEVAQVVYKDACAKCIADVSDLRDLKTMRSRVEDEGMSFLTITLPNFCKDFERSLADGEISASAFPNFRKSGAIPAFLQGMLGCIFDRETGRIFNEQELSRSSTTDISTIIESVRQVCLTFKKVEIPCTPARESKAMDKFIEVEQSFDTFSPSDEEREDFLLVSRVLWDNCLAPIVLSDCNPRHGPGATADKRSGNQKFIWLNWHDRLEPYFPFLGNAYPLGTPQDSGEFENVTIVSQDAEVPVKVTPVPKTLKGPRIIAVEPCCMQYVQQGIRDVLYDLLESSLLTKGHINFRDQSINQGLAITSSSDGLLATIDLSDASDRVPRDLALYMFRSNPDLLDAIVACRSTKAEMPDGQVIGPLGKFASMGSALCFPVEAMYFYTICVLALLKKRNLPISGKSVFKVSRQIFVYGDDIVIPSTDAILVLDYLQKYNCKVNSAKSFWTGRFRESCGVDAYAGEVVSPTYLGTLPPKNQQQPDRLISWTATANLFYKRGYWLTAQALFKRVESVIGSLPYLSDTSPGLGRSSFHGYRSIERWNSKLHRFEVKAMVPYPVYKKCKLENYAALGASLSRLGNFDTPSLDDWSQRKRWGESLVSPVDKNHLERYALHGAVTLKRRWVPST
jgi:hypothetical protein